MNIDLRIFLVERLRDHVYQLNILALYNIRL